MKNTLPALLLGLKIMKCVYLYAIIEEINEKTLLAQIPIIDGPENSVLAGDCFNISSFLCDSLHPLQLEARDLCWISYVPI